MRQISRRATCFWLSLWLLILAVVNTGPPNALGGTLLAGDAKHFLNVGWGLAQAPFRFSPADWGKTGLIIGSTCLLFTIDKNVKRFTLSPHRAFYDELFNLDRYYGNRYTFVSAVGLYGLGYLMKSNRARLMGLHSVEAITYATNITGLLKILLGRRRPSAGEDNLVFRPLKHQAIYSSLPSYHATVGFAASTVMAKSLDYPLWKIFWYGAGVVVAASRVHHNTHWVSDVFLGGAVGYVTASYVMSLDKDGSAKRGRLGEFHPYFFPYGLGGLLRLP